MGAAPVNPQTNKKPNRRSRKKRRTQDFSSSEESSSSSSSSSESEHESDTETELDQQKPANANNINIDDIDIDSDNEQLGTTFKSLRAPENLIIEQKQQLQTIPFTTTPVSNLTNNAAVKTIPDSASITNDINKTKTELNNRYLKLMAMEFENDLDELRKKPDFNEHSLVLLAKTLQSGVNMFDPDSLNGLLD